MVALREFYLQKMEHNQGSLLVGAAADSKFYGSHPDKLVASKVGKERRGCHHNLQMCILLGAPLEANVDKLADIFGCTPGCKWLMQMGKINKNLSAKQNQKRSFHCALELAYGLCLNPNHNVSSSFGWEQALKICDR